MIQFRAIGTEVEVVVDGSELAILSSLTNLLGSAGVEKRDPARARLNPVVYRDDEAASREFERFAAKERSDVRTDDRERFAEMLQAVTNGTLLLKPDEAAIWARVLGEARIVLAARKGLFEKGLPTEAPSDPELALVMLLGYLQEELVGEMLKTMEDTQ
jgi:hypothetical protein